MAINTTKTPRPPPPRQTVKPKMKCSKLKHGVEKSGARSRSNSLPLPLLSRFQIGRKGTSLKVAVKRRNKVIATRRQKSTVKTTKTNARVVNSSATQSKCGPGTTITPEGNCVPATPSNVFGMSQTTVGRAPVPSDYSCETRKPTGVLLTKLLDAAVISFANGNALPVHTMALLDAVWDTKDFIFSSAP